MFNADSVRFSPNVLLQSVSDFVVTSLISCNFNCFVPALVDCIKMASESKEPWQGTGNEAAVTLPVWGWSLTAAVNT